jgi:hypothetical protein
VGGNTLICDQLKGQTSKRDQQSDRPFVKGNLMVSAKKPYQKDHVKNGGANFHDGIDHKAYLLLIYSAYFLRNSAMRFCATGTSKPFMEMK